MCKSNMQNYEEVLAGWYLERKQQLETSLASTVRNADMVNNKSPFVIFFRDWGFWLLQLIPSIRKKLQLGARSYRPTQYQYEPGMAFLPEMGGGCSFAQAFCVELLDHGHGDSIQFTDDVIFASAKTKLFQIVILADNLTEAKHAEMEMKGIDERCSHLSPTEATVLVRRRTMGERSATHSLGACNVFRTATAREFEQSSLCEGRPEPRGYSEETIWEGVKSRRYVIVRHDRFVFAACDTRGELAAAAERLEALFPTGC